MFWPSRMRQFPSPNVTLSWDLNSPITDNRNWFNLTLSKIHLFCYKFSYEVQTSQHISYDQLQTKWISNEF